MGKSDESRGLRWQWDKPTEVPRVAVHRGFLHPGFALDAARTQQRQRDLS